MFSSNKNIECISQLVEDIKQYIGLQKDYVKLDVVEKLILLSTALILGVILLVLAAMILFYFSFASIYIMEKYMGISLAGGYSVITVFFIILFIFVFAFRKKWIEKPLTRFLSKVLLSDDGQSDE
jgi:uncharacterized membrane protein